MTIRRVLDVVVSAALLAVTAPLFLALLAVNFLWTGRAFFSQIRLGRDLQPFVILKFQTMTRATGGGSTVTVAADPRITPYGRILRALKLDELPQLLNILAGEMTLVGPRPLTRNEIAAVPQDLARLVYRAAPGLTGISAFAFADEERLLAGDDAERRYFEEILPRKVALELAYAQHPSWQADLILALATPSAPFVPPLRRWIVSRLVPGWTGLTASRPAWPRMISLETAPAPERSATPTVRAGAHR